MWYGGVGIGEGLCTASPIALKDNIDTAGIRTTAASELSMRRSEQPTGDFDATLS